MALLLFAVARGVNTSKEDRKVKETAPGCTHSFFAGFELLIKYHVGYRA
jgi:hypothetical protein